MMKRAMQWFAAASFVLCSTDARAACRTDDDQQDQLPVTLGEVRAFPEAYKRVPFDLALLFHGPRDVYNPFYTVFEPSRYLNFAAWEENASLFSREGYAADYPLFYVDRNNVELQKLVVSTRPCTWLNARCIVRSTAQDRAWIEVLAITRVGATIDTTDLRHLIRANVLAGNGEFDRALLEIALAKLPNAAPRFLARCRGEEGRIALAANQPERALVALQQAGSICPEDTLITALLDRASTQVAMRRDQQRDSVPAAPPAPLRAPTIDPQAPAAPLPKVETPIVTPEAPPAEAPKNPDPMPELPVTPSPAPPETNPDPVPDTEPKDHGDGG